MIDAFGIFGRRHSNRAYTDYLNRKSRDSIESVMKNQPKVDSLTRYLNERREQNNFAKDFEVTLKPRKRDDSA